MASSRDEAGVCSSILFWPLKSPQRSLSKTKYIFLVTEKQYEYFLQSSNLRSTIFFFVVNFKKYNVTFKFLLNQSTFYYSKKFRYNLRMGRVLKNSFSSTSGMFS